MKANSASNRYRAVMEPSARLGQVMTPQPLADAVMRLLGSRGGRWLELGSGSGRLAEAIYNRAGPVSYLGIEMDEAMIDLSPVLPGFTYLKQDVLSVTSLTHSLGRQKFDHVIGNPPYGINGLSDEAKVRIQTLCPELEIQGNWAPIDLYFVLESLSRLRSNGTGAFIVGADIPCGIRNQQFRKMIVETASEIECYELPPTTFGSSAEVQAYILIVRFGRGRTRHVSLGRLNGQYEVTSLRQFDRALAIESMDLRDHEFGEMDAALRRSSHGITMRDLDVSIVRGSRSRRQFSQLGVRHFHTSDFPKSGMEISLECESVTEYQQATVGDVLLPRVGTRCLGHKAVVVGGRSPYSEAVFRVRTPVKYRERVERWITSDECSNWRLSAARGACAKHLTVSTLLGMPVPT